MRETHDPAVDHLFDSPPVMLARGGHAYSATVARDLADVGYGASKKQYFTVCACTRWHSAAVGSCHCHNNSGGVKRPVTIG